jgi:gliding motility-associated protein GldL
MGHGKKGGIAKVQHWLETDSGQGFSNTATCVGAAIVLLGALFKIMHWPGASIMLCAGMFTEVVLFLMFAIIPPHKNYHWEKVYPGLAVLPDDDPNSDLYKIAENLKNGNDSVESKNSIVAEKFDEMVTKADINEEYLIKFGENFKSLSENISKLNKVTDIAVATETFAQKTNEVTGKIEQMSTAYSNATAVIALMSEKMKKMGENNAEFADVTDVKAAKEQYIEKTKAATNGLDNVNTTYLEVAESMSAVAKAMKDLDASFADTKRYKDEMALLTESVASMKENLAAMNKVYVGMLMAMGQRTNMEMESNHVLKQAA